MNVILARMAPSQIVRIQDPTLTKESKVNAKDANEELLKSLVAAVRSQMDTSIDVETEHSEKAM